MLVGSDYTIGLQGVGPVTALEIIAEFATNRIEEIGDPEELVIPLKRFRQWWQSKEMTNIRRRRLKNSLKELHFHEGFIEA
jgi:5'-3' exonuclease